MKFRSVIPLMMLLAGCSSSQKDTDAVQTSVVPEGVAVSNRTSQAPSAEPVQAPPQIASAQGLVDEVSDEELEGMAGGLSCEGRDASGRRVLYSDGSGLIRYRGETVELAEDGVGGNELRSANGPFLRVRLEKRPGKVRHLEEGSEEPKRMILEDADGTTSLDITYSCSA